MKTAQADRANQSPTQANQATYQVSNQSRSPTLPPRLLLGGELDEIANHHKASQQLIPAASLRRRDSGNNNMGTRPKVEGARIRRGEQTQSTRPPEQVSSASN